MKLLILLPIILLLGAAPPPPTPSSPAFPLPDIVRAQLWGDQILLLHTDKSITLVGLSDLQVEQPVVLNSYGYPKVFMSEDKVPGNPNVLETSYKSTVGTHVVRTSCKGYSNVRCAEKHKAQLLALQTVFPKSP
jgi:hypothetical protein